MEGINVGIWSVLPPVIAIALALITKEVIFSLVLGILSGAIIYSIAGGLGFVGIFQTTMDLMGAKLGENAAMVLFLALLGSLVALMTRAGGARAYGEWAVKKIKTTRAAGLTTALLGCLIFIDDYFNCLTVGTVMRPVTDRHKISHEKLSYFIDATAAPVCIIAPISSWAAAVASYAPEGQGLQLFIQAIPMNLYAILTIIMVIYMGCRPHGDYGPMARAQKRAYETGQLDLPEASTDKHGEDDLANLKISEKGKVLDLVLPVIFLVVFSVLSMLLYGGFFEEGGGNQGNLIGSFGDTSAGPALALGAFCTLLVTFFIYLPRKIMSFKDFFAAIGSGIKSMVPALIILTLAWTISGVCRDLLLTGPYVADLVTTSNFPVILIPVIMFVVAAFISFATGTSWGTFGILIPITIDICMTVAPELNIITLSAVMAGSVFGDHCSPISDTTILSSTGAHCRHIDHVATQIPYAMTVAAACIPGYLIGGILHNMSFALDTVITLAISIVLLFLALFIAPKVAGGD
ncbi:MAG: Na+/H+ antiporter NhaC family protein [Spirochaetaceae bacterium]|nr:Na+/H+ antiporter NhaC family protein [Spirochaetaceae bacterium]